MLKALIDGDRKMLVLGLSKLNIERLKAGYPIVVDDLVDRIGKEIFIFSGDTEQSMANDLQEFIGPDSRVKVDPRLTDREALGIEQPEAAE